MHPAGWTATSSPAWRTCSISMPNNRIRTSRWCALTRVRSRCSAKFVSRSRPLPGGRGRWDCEYRRHGTMMLFVMVDAHRPWRRVMLSEQRTGLEFALCMRALVDRGVPARPPHPHCPGRPVDAHAGGALPGVPGPRKPAASCAAWSSTTPQSMPVGSTWWRSRSASSKGQCLDRRVSDPEVLKAEITAWESARNSAGARIRWMFATEKARAKMGRAYPQPASPDGPVKPSESL